MKKLYFLLLFGIGIRLSTVSAIAAAGPNMTYNNKASSKTQGMDLGQLFRYYGTDKDFLHGYTTVYHTLFDHLRTQPITFLEIGIGTMIPGAHSSMVGYAAENYQPGGSLRAWRDYFVNGIIYGLDIQPDTQFNDEPRIFTYLCNSTVSHSVEEFMKKIGNIKFDVIIDDGSHLADDQLRTLSNFYPHLKNDGIYIIEDLYQGNRLRTNPQDIAKYCDHDPYFFAGLKDPFCIIYKSHLDRDTQTYRY